MAELSGNKGEWSEIYIFLKLMKDGKVYAADRNMQKLETVFLNIVKIIREEVLSQKYEYYTGKQIKIFLNGEEVGPTVEVEEFEKYKNILWEKLSSTVRGNGIVCEDVELFLKGIHITKLKAPAFSSSNFFGGTEDITMEVMDYRSGVNSTIGFSCKSDFSAKSTLFNASADNTNFVFEVTGNVDDDVMNEFNNIFNYRNKTNKETGEKEMKPEVAIGDRMRYLKTKGCNLCYEKMCVENAERNLVLSGGAEMPVIIANMLRAYYFIGEGKVENSSLLYALETVIEDNVAGYGFGNTESMYYRKLGTLLYDMFTGMRLSKAWDGRSSVNGGYIIAKNDGEVLAYHSCMADEFKDFLIEQLGFESPSATRHRYLEMYKEDNRYFLKLNLQVRFKGNGANPDEGMLKRVLPYIRGIINS